MCLDPLSMIGMAMSAASTAAQAQSQSAFVDAQNKANNDAYAMSKQARVEEIARQKAFEDKSATTWKDTLAGLGAKDFNTEKGKQETDFQTDLAALPQTIADGQMLSGQQNASSEIQSEIAARSAKAAQEARGRIKALAALTGTDLTGQVRSQTLGTSADTLGLINSMRRGSLGVSSQEQNISPAQVTQGSSIFGDLLGGVGGILTNRGGFNETSGQKVASAPVYKPNTLGAYLVNG